MSLSTLSSSLIFSCHLSCISSLYISRKEKKEKSLLCCVSGGGGREEGRHVSLSSSATYPATCLVWENGEGGDSGHGSSLENSLIYRLLYKWQWLISSSCQPLSSLSVLHHVWKKEKKKENERRKEGRGQGAGAGYLSGRKLSNSVSAAETLLVSSLSAHLSWEEKEGKYLLCLSLIILKENVVCGLHLNLSCLLFLRKNRKGKRRKEKEGTVTDWKTGSTLTCISSKKKRKKKKEEEGEERGRGQPCLLSLSEKSISSIYHVKDISSLSCYAEKKKKKNRKRNLIFTQHVCDGRTGLEDWRKGAV